MSWKVSGGRGNNFKTEVEEPVRFFCFPLKETRASLGNIKSRNTVLRKGEKNPSDESQTLCKELCSSSTTTI